MKDDPWRLLRGCTAARIGLGRVGASMPTHAVLDFSMAHAQARDAVRKPLDFTALESRLAAMGIDTLRVASLAVDRDQYLRRPDLGRRLDDASRAALRARPQQGSPLLVVVGDGLSSTAVAANAADLIAALQPYGTREGWPLGTVLLATQARVALADDAGELLRARVSLMLIGERPGLSSPDSLGAYLTWDPRTGRHDGERNCVSNIRKGGLPMPEAAFRIAWLLRESFRRQVSGVSLKDESDYLLDGPAATSLPAPG